MVETDEKCQKDKNQSESQNHKREKRVNCKFSSSTLSNWNLISINKSRQYSILVETGNSKAYWREWETETIV